MAHLHLEPPLITAVAPTCPGGEVLLAMVVLVQLEALKEVGAVRLEGPSCQKALKCLGQCRAGL